jgi:Spy/CpxP family protein refolding chaperone
MPKFSVLLAALCCLVLMSITAGSFAQAPAGPGARGEKMMERLTTQLGLSPAQVDQIKPILKSMRSKAMQIRNDSTLTDAQKAAQIKALRQATMNEIKPILTPDQIAKWKAMRANRASYAPKGVPAS